MEPGEPKDAVSQNDRSRPDEMSTSPPRLVELG